MGNRLSKELRSTLPISRLPEPENFWQRCVYTFWWLWAPVHPFFRDLFIKLHLLNKHTGRQDFLLGHFAPNVDINGFLKYIEGRGYGNQFIAWWDDGEVISLRKLDPQNAEFQYHLRVFSDGEVRGHYEYTPEFHPRLHVREIGFLARRKDFLDDLKGWVVPATSVEIEHAVSAAPVPTRCEKVPVTVSGRA